jgi:hypothetical protein
MFLPLRASRITSGFSVWNDREGVRYESSRSISFSVVADGQAHLDLKTGEIFQSSARASNLKQEDRQISALLVLKEFGDEYNDEVKDWNKMEYHAAFSDAYVQYSSKSKIIFLYYLPEKEFSLIHSNVLSGQPLDVIHVEFEYPIYDTCGLTYGHERGGSGKIWDNDIGYVPIKGISFAFHHYGNTEDDNSDY